MIYPLTTGFHWGALDFQWYIEGCQSRPGPAENQTGFHDVNRFITLKPHPHSGYQSIPDFVEMRLKGGQTGLKTPYEVAAELDAQTTRGHSLVAELKAEPGTELARTLDDIRTMAHLGQYYADKIRGATRLELYRTLKESDDREQAIVYLAQAARHWADYAMSALKNHKNPLWTNRVGYVDWKLNYLRVLDDIRIAGGAPDALGLAVELDAPNEEIPRFPYPSGTAP